MNDDPHDLIFSRMPVPGIFEPILFSIVDPKIAQQLRTHVHERRLPMIVTRLLHYQQAGIIRKDVDLSALAFGISSLAFTVGFMGREVFEMDAKRLEAVSANMAKILCKGACP